MKLTEETIGTQHIFSGKIINVRVDTVRLENGATATREIVEHPGGVCVISVDDEGYTLMVRQFRAPLNAVILEVPAGKLNYGEDHLECGKREFTEETGYTAQKYTYLGKIYPSVGFLNEALHIYMAENLERAAQKLDDDEFLTVERYKLSDLVDMVMKNEIQDAKTIAAILMANKKKDRL